MLKIHTSDGLTSRVDLADEAQAKEWLQRLRDPAFQQSITGATIVQKTAGRYKCPKCGKPGRFECSDCGRLEQEYNGSAVQYSLARPEGFVQIFYWPEAILPNEESKVKGGEKVTCFVDDIRITVMVHRSQPSVRISLLKTGKQRYNPFTRDANMIGVIDKE